MPVASMKEILDRGFTERYGVAAFNILNDLTIEAILAAAVEENAPVIIQTSVKTVRQYGRDQLFAMFSAFARDVPSLDMAGASLTLVRLDEEIERLLEAPAEVAVRVF